MPRFRNLKALAELHEIGQAYGVAPAAQCGVNDEHAAFCINQVARLAGIHVARERQAEAEEQLRDADGRPIALDRSDRQLGPLRFPKSLPILPEADQDQDAIDLKGLL